MNMLAIFITALIVFLVTSLFGYVIHWALHQTWSGKFNERHMTHHLVLYPPDDYQSPKYRSAGKNNSFRTFFLASIPLVLIPIVLGVIGILPLSLVITTLVVMGVVGFLHDYFHDAFHIKNHPLSKVPIIKNIFIHWNDLHYLHHVDLQTNFGIFFFYWDRFFGTYWKSN